MIYEILFRIRKIFHKWEMLQHNKFLRKKIIRAGGVIGKGGRFGKGVVIMGVDKLTIGDNVHIGTGGFIRANGGLSIGSNTIISRNLLLYTVNHDYEGELIPFDNNLISKPVVIGENVWIGMNVTICPGAVIGEGSVIGMGATVFGNIPRCSVVGAAGCKIIKSRNIEHYEFLKNISAFAKEDGMPLFKPIGHQRD